MTKERIKEDLSICYLKAVSAAKGVELEEFRHDEDSTDVVIKKFLVFDDGRRFNSQISVQLKATSSSSQYKMGQDDLTYRLKAKNYNDLCEPSAMPSILALLILPEDEKEWIDWNEKELLLRGQMFWISLQGKERSANSESVSVKIPKTNRINKDLVEELLKKAAVEGRL